MSNNLPAIRKIITGAGMQAMIQQRIGEKAGVFTTSLLDLIGDNTALQRCDINLVVKEAIKAPALDLPINNNLGFAYIIPYNESKQIDGKWVKTPKPQFQIGYKGFVQLAIRTGQYKHLNADAIYDGEVIIVDKIRGTMELTGKATSENVVGYFAYMELINGFEKATVWTKDKVIAHGNKFSKTFNNGPWKSDFDAMAKKTILKSLISKYGPLSIDIANALSSDSSDLRGHDDMAQYEIETNANQEYIDITPRPVKMDEPGPDGMTAAQKNEALAQELAEAEAQTHGGPDF
jgi:recombination protein RecT